MIKFKIRRNSWLKMIDKKILDVKNLHVSLDDIPILCGINLTINLGEIHVIMGPNGSGKSTFSKVIAGHPSYRVTQGSILFNSHSLLSIEADERARKGIFLGFQYPVEIPGVTNIDFLRLAYNSIQYANNKKEMNPLEFFQLVTEKTGLINMDTAFLSRNVNEGFSGGEKKKNEILQMSLLEPKLAILDETDVLIYKVR
uniref:Sulfate ABC transporter protein n=1 Tax=Compsopogon caeruleus TaxID=31354 RepID=A0A1Z1XBF2_9RHOD|nr:sulfate ABC transporter protein [Compsopogon caeruleus]ARX96127.1 sulfate ABC transporter protein [Compsopogon caeruleus]